MQAVRQSGQLRNSPLLRLYHVQRDEFHHGGVECQAGYELLGLQTFFTVGPKEARAWTVKANTTAPKAAGVIHSDFEDGFIRAETISYADFVDFGGELGAKEAGKLRSEGKTYLVQDGDVLKFLFNK